VYRETGPYGREGKVARYYLAESPGGEVRLPVSPELGRPEHDEWRWASYAEARALLPPRLQPVLAWAHALSGEAPAERTRGPEAAGGERPGGQGPAERASRGGSA
ncbi:MAG: hypothetical protein D6809_06825, partial [Gammaproteobacteria bacterium]